MLRSTSILILAAVISGGLLYVVYTKVTKPSVPNDKNESTLKETGEQTASFHQKSYSIATTTGQKTTATSTTDSIKSAVIVQKTNTQVTASSSCDLVLAITGSALSTKQCDFEILKSGENPGYTTYIVSIKGAEGSVINSISLSNFESLSKGTYQLDVTSGKKDFVGQLLEKNISRNLLSGQIYIDPQANESVKVQFDLTFANDIRVQGSGLLPIKHISAP